MTGDGRDAGRPEEKVCRRCDNTFVRKRTYFDSYWKRLVYCSRRCAATRRYISENEICRLYVNGASTTEISLMAGISGKSVAMIVRKYKLTRSAHDRQVLAKSKPELRKRMSLLARGRPCKETVKDTLRKRTGSKNHNWRSGLTISQGYICFTASRANGAHARKALHTLIAEWRLGRRLLPGEVVHHRDENKMNNHPDNIIVMNRSEHNKHHAIKDGLGHHAGPRPKSAARAANAARPATKYGEVVP